MLESKKSAFTQEELKEITLNKIAEIDAEVEIYTDGSTSGDQTNGGAGIHIRSKDGKVIAEISTPAGKYCSSYDGEGVTMIKAIQWITEKNENNKRFAIYTDSRSLVDALKTNNWRDSSEWLRMIKSLSRNLQQDITLYWIPSHCGTEGNEEADRLANVGAKLPQENVPVSYNIMKAKIRSLPWIISHERAKNTYKERRSPRYDIEAKWPLAVRGLYCRLRTGHAAELRRYGKMIGKEDDESCPLCSNNEDMIEHVICECPALETKRKQNLNVPFNLEFLTTKPEECRKVLSARFQQLVIENTDNE